MRRVKVGQVIHYFDKLQVAIIKLTQGDLKVDDELVLVSKDGQEIEQTVSSMQIEHTQIDLARKGDIFGLKTEKKVREKSDLFKKT